MRLIVGSIIGFLLSGAAGAGAPPSATSRPNILFIMTDDQAPWALAAAGDPNAVTPQMDRLRSEGVLLTACYTPTPVCSPSRASILTSRYGTEVGITDYLGKSEDKLSLTVPTWPRLLAQAGYATGLIGKYHCGNTAETHPTKIGYGEFSGFLMAGETSRNPKVERNGVSQQMEGWTEDILAGLAIEFIRNHVAGPFALSLHFWAPHAQEYKNSDGDRTWLPLSDEDWNAVKEINLRLPEPDYPDLDAKRNLRMLREYLGSVHSADRNIGKVLAVLDELNLRNNTVVIFTSDNGYNLGHHGVWHKGNGLWLLQNDRSVRSNLWDNSLRVPAIVRWPGMVPAGSTVDEQISFLDWFPTLVAIAGARAPEGAVLRGHDVRLVLQGKARAEESGFFGQYKMRGGSDMRSYQTKQWKLVRYLDRSQPDEFYDRQADPAERHNLSRSTDKRIRGALEELNARLVESMKSIDDPSIGLVSK
ncbi:MAG: N-acetylgalactosamine 6-sulfate sulfatase [Opitutus sp.]|nr:N-acetylgalactosamine 6-sulfate sulfatase [Opitutus sp.]